MTIENIKQPICEHGAHKHIVLHGVKNDRMGRWQMFKCQNCGHIWKGHLIEGNK